MSNKSLITFVVLFGAAGSAMAVEKTVEAARARVSKQYSATLAAFIENVGQIADPTVRYVFRGSGANIFHTTKGPVFQLFQQEKVVQEVKPKLDESAEFRGLSRHPRMDKKDIVRRACNFSMRFIGTRHVRPIGRSKQETKVNYFIGCDPNKWHTDVATYSEVVYPELYDGINLHTLARRSHLKYEFHVAAGADYTQIVIAYEGTSGLKIDSKGLLHINTPLGELVDKVPYIYQIIDGQQVQIPGRYRLIDDNSYTFEIRDRVKPTVELVIDPHLSWASYLGGSGNESGYSIAVDAIGNAFLTGSTDSDDFPTTYGVYQLVHSSQKDAFVAKVSSGGQLLWATYLGGSGNDASYGIAVDSLGYLLVTGSTDSPTYSFPTTYGAFQRENNGGIDAFVTKLNSTGSGFFWSTLLGGSGNDSGNGIAVDVNDVVLLTGDTNSTDFPTTPGKPLTWSYAGQTDAFVAKVSQNAQGYPFLQWCQCRGGSDDDWGYAVAVDIVGNSLVVGATASPCYFTTTTFTDYGGGKDVFVAKFDTQGNVGGSVSAFCGYLGGSGDDEGYGIAAGQDEKGGLYTMLTGYTKSSDFPASGGFDNSYCCYADAFVARINYATPNMEPTKPQLAWSSYLGGGVNDVGHSIALVGKGQVFPPETDDYALVTGFTSSYNFPTPEGFDPNYNGGEDAFVTKVMASGQLVWSSYLGGSGNDIGYGIAVNSEGSALLTGATDSNDFPTRGEGDSERNGGEDAFVAKISKDKIIGRGKLHGTVWDQNGVAIVDANVIVQGQMTHTNIQGQFSFDSKDANHPTTFDLFAGQTVVMVSKGTAYYPVAKIVTIDVNSTTRVNLQMAENLGLSEPSVVEVRSRYCGPGKHPYYLHGPTLYEKFLATIDWGNYEPNRIEWQTPRRGYSDTVSGGTIPVFEGCTTHGRCFNMGNDFGVGQNSLKVTAVGYMYGVGEVSSPTKTVSFFEIIAPPSYIDANDANDPNVVKVVFTGNGFEYKILLPGFDLAPWDDPNKVNNGMPLFNGENMNVGAKFKNKPEASDSKLVGRVNNDGTSDVYTEGSDGMSKTEVHLFVPCAGVNTPRLPCGVEIKVYATADFFCAWDHAENDWGLGGALNTGCLFNYESPPFYLPPVCGIPPYAKYAFDLDLGLRSELMGWAKGGPEWACLFYFEPLCKGILGAGFAGNVCVEGHLGGGFHGEIELAPDLGWGDHYIVLVGGVEVIVGSTTLGGGQLRYCWWPNPGMYDMSTMHGFRVLDELQDGGDYYHNPGCPAELGYNEDMIEPNEFPYCTPQVVRIGDDMLAVWLHDNRDRPSPIHRTELKSIRYDGNWAGKKTIDDNGTADMNPQLIALPEGDAVCIWQDAKITLNDSCSDVETFNQNLEIAVKKYISSTGTWSNMMGLVSHRLTNDNYFDRSPQLAVDESDAENMLAVWISNEHCNTWGDSTSVNRIKWRKYYYGWEGANNTIDATFGMILGTALAYKDGIATYVFCKDGDNDLNTPGDQRLWQMTYPDSTDDWTMADWLTNDGNDTSPRLIYDNEGNLLLFWVKGDDICMAKGNGSTITRNDVDQAEVVVTPGGSIGSKDFDLVKGDRGQIAILWSDVSVWHDYPKQLDPNHFDPARIDPDYFDPNYSDSERIPKYINPNYADPNHIPVCHDIWISYYESNLDVWSMPRQLTWDKAAERFITAAFEPNDTLLCIYNKRQTEFQPIDCNAPDANPNHHLIRVENVPKAGPRSDVVYLRDILKGDLAIELEDVSIEPANPMPGTWAKVLANVKNLGISPASNFTVVFSDCNVPFAAVFVAEDYADGDLDHDGDVDMRDLAIFIDHWQKQDCGPWNDWCKESDIDNSVNVNFRDFRLLAMNWHISVPPQILVGGGEVEVSAHWNVPKVSLPREISVTVVPDNIQDDPNNNTVSFDILAPDLTISEMDSYITGPNSIVTVRVANKGVLPAYDKNNQVKVALRTDAPDGALLQEKTITYIEPMAYHDVPFILELPQPGRVYAVVDPNEAVEEFNEDNNIRSVTIR